MSAFYIVLVGAGAALVLRPWRQRPRRLVESPPPAMQVSRVRVGAFRARLDALGKALSIDSIRRSVGSRRNVRRGDELVAKALPDVVDLVLLGVGAGLTPRDTLARCRPWLPAPFASAIEVALRRASDGESFAVALELTLAPLGERVRPLVACLVAGEHDGAALGTALIRVGDETLRRRRVDAQARARRVPIMMLFPLVVCVLPAFVLLTVAPLALGSLADLGFDI